MQTQTLKLKNGAVKLPEMSLSSGTLTVPTALRGKIAKQTDAISRGIKIPAQKLFTATKEKIRAVDTLLVRYTKIERFIIRCVAIIVAIDILLFAIFVIKIFTPLSSADRTVLSSFLGPSGSSAHTLSTLSGTPLGGSAETLLTALKQKNPAALALGEVSRPGLSVPGRILSVDGATVFAFQYGSPDKAHAEALSLAGSYAQNTKPGVWNSQTHVYVKDDLVIFYLGANDALLASLSDFAGNSLVNEKTQTKKLAEK